MSEIQRFVGYPSALIFALSASTPDVPPAKLAALKQLLWGDELVIVGKSADARYYRAKVRGVEGWISAADTQENRLLEIVFVDIGQGDGALVITPENQTMVIDTGQGDNMYRFLKWRFGLTKPFSFDAAIISHSDLDHYGGFEQLFGNANVSFKALYTNGLMERNDKSAPLGRRESEGRNSYITELVGSMDELRAFFATPAHQGKRYPTMLKSALEQGKFAEFARLDHTDQHLPGYLSGAPLEIRVLGPCVHDFNGAPALRWFGNTGKTKNGHSVVMKFVIGKVSIFMGGDLNIESSRLLLETHTGLSGDPSNAEAEATLVAAARPIFACDVAKACHHGSADTLLPFMQAINPAATVISSGDDEPHAHPRADALGAIARCSRGLRPLLLSTELARSSKEAIKFPSILRAKLKLLAKKIAETEGEARVKAEENYEKQLRKIERSVAVYGAINLRTDGTRVVLAYKLERSKPAQGWDIYRLEPLGANGPLAYQSKYDA